MLDIVLIRGNSCEKGQYSCLQGDYNLMEKQKTNKQTTAKQVILECPRCYEDNYQGNMIKIKKIK